eukprot:Skav234969  [mRNA]  locus=scaffold943:572264:572833:+ [translate_table: standard]
MDMPQLPGGLPHESHRHFGCSGYPKGTRFDEPYSQGIIPHANISFGKPPPSYQPEVPLEDVAARPQPHDVSWCFGFKPDHFWVFVRAQEPRLTATDFATRCLLSVGAKSKLCRRQDKHQIEHLQELCGESGLAAELKEFVKGAWQAEQKDSSRPKYQQAEEERCACAEKPEKIQVTQRSNLGSWNLKNL